MLVSFDHFPICDDVLDTDSYPTVKRAHVLGRGRNEKHSRQYIV